MKKKDIRSILFWFLFFPLAVLQSAEAGDKKANQPLRILCLGDSITQASEDRCGYRYLLWKKLVDHKIEIDFIGSMNKRYYETPGSDCPSYHGKTFDPDHEGHWAWRADEILGGTNVLPPESGQGNLSEWLKGYTPDIVLMHLGHNDAGRREAASLMAGELKQIITLLQKDNPKVAILLAKVTPVAKPDWKKQLDILNAEIEGIAKDMRTSSSDVIVIDFSKVFNPFKDTIDGIHPTDVGVEKMANKWFHGILKLLDKP
jgi:hypothetical protein